MNLPLLFDQRGPSAKVFSGIDVKETAKDKRRERKHTDLVRKFGTVVEGMRTEIELEEEENDLEQTEEFETDPTFKPPPSHSKKVSVTVTILFQFLTLQWPSEEVVCL